MDGQFFSRSATWERMDDMLVVHDTFGPAAPRMITMDPWPELVFMSADGQHTVGQFVQHMASRYEGGPPAGLREQVHQSVASLVEEGVLRLHGQAEELPPYFQEEYSAQPPEVRKQQMQADGRLPSD